MANRKTLLAQLAPMFGSQTENLAVEALGHILSGSAAARGALSELLEAARRLDKSLRYTLRMSVRTARGPISSERTRMARNVS